MPDLSIIILTYNNKKVLCECIDSVIANTKASSYEIIVADNNSIDGTSRTMKEKYPQATLISNDKNLGFSRANNQGLKLAKGRYAVILNDDTYLKSDAFTQVAAFLDENPEVGICGPMLRNPDGTVQQQGSVLSYLTWRSKSPREAGLVIGACMFIRMSMLPKTGLFDENLFFYNDDLDMCRQAKQAGYKVMYFPDAQVYHYGGFTAKKQVNKFLMVEGYRGGLYFCRKHYGSPAYHAYRCVLLLSVVLMLPFTINNAEKMKAYLEIIKIILLQQIIYKS